MIKRTGIIASMALAGVFGLSLALTPVLPVSSADATTNFNFNNNNGKKLVKARKIKHRAPDKIFFLNPACLIPGGGGVVCAAQELNKKKN